MKNEYTAIVRKSRLEYVAVCLELNVTARGADIAEVEENLHAAIELYLQDIEEYPETIVSPMQPEELIEFLQDTEMEPELRKKEGNKFLLRPFELHQIPAYV